MSRPTVETAFARRRAERYADLNVSARELAELETTLRRLAHESDAMHRAQPSNYTYEVRALAETAWLDVARAGRSLRVLLKAGLP